MFLRISGPPSTNSLPKTPCSRARIGERRTVDLAPYEGADPKHYVPISPAGAAAVPLPILYPTHLT